MNKARQYGKTTTLRALAKYLQNDYTVTSLDFQQMSTSDFESESAFVHGLAREIARRFRRMDDIPDDTRHRLLELSSRNPRRARMADIFDCFRGWCEHSQRPVVLIIDEVDTAADNQVFLDFLAQLRAAYMDSDATPAFQSVILASVYDIRSIQRRLRPDEHHKPNSPWNIAARFRVDMSFSPEEIAGTKDFPDRTHAWTKDGLIEAEKLLVNENNTLFQPLTGKLADDPQLRSVLYELLFTGKPIPYVPQNSYIDAAQMFGFIKNDNGTAAISNRIFESVLYNLFISEEFSTNKMYDAGVMDRNQFVTGGHLNVRRILEKFTETFGYLYGDADETFLEDAGRRYFLLFLKPIINGAGNSYVEPETRNRERMDLVIAYRGEQFIIELKIWRGNAYNERGEQQLSDYLDYFHLKKGYMLSFNFNKKKTVGVKEVILGDKVLIEAVV